MSPTGNMRGANIPWRLSKEFITDILMDGADGYRAKGSVGNTKAGPSSQASKGWGAAEGLATDGKAAEFCDGIADWWPDVRHICMHVNVLHLFIVSFMSSNA
jgi:hypothetical protein